MTAGLWTRLDPIHNEYLFTDLYNEPQVLAILSITAFVACHYAISRSLFERVSGAELERVRSECLQCIAEVVLSFTIFRKHASKSFFSLLVISTSVRPHHWIHEDRYAKSKSNRDRRTEHWRAIGSTAVLAAIDLVIMFCSMNYGIVPKLFALETSIRLLTLIQSTAESILSVPESDASQQHPQYPPPPPPAWHLATSLIFGTARIAERIYFVFKVLPEYALPVHIIKSLIEEGRSMYCLFAQCEQTQAMDHWLDSFSRKSVVDDGMCLICRDDLFSKSSCPDAAVRSLPCHHAFHSGCLRGWIGRQHSCPTCRAVLKPTTPAPKRKWSFTLKPEVSEIGRVLVPLPLQSLSH